MTAESIAETAAPVLEWLYPQPVNDVGCKKIGVARGGRVGTAKPGP